MTPEPQDRQPADGRHIELPFTTASRCLVLPAVDIPAAAAGRPEPHGKRPPLLVALHGQGQSGDRHARWMLPAVPPGFVAAFPDGFHAHEVRKPERKPRLGYGWYLFTGDQQAFAESVMQSEVALWRLIDAIQTEWNTDPERIYLAGFSQGCYLAHCIAVRANAQLPGRIHPGRIKGWIGQSGRLKNEFLEDELPAVSGHRVLIQHGQDDQATPLEFAERSARILREHGADVNLSTYPAGHVITTDMVRDARAWLEAGEPRESDG